MPDEPQQPAAEWQTYRLAAARLGLQASAVAARARRGHWPRRRRNDGQAEILVPGELLAKPPQTPQEARPAPAPDNVAPNVAATVEAAVGAAVGPLVALLERKDAELAALRADHAAGQVEIARADTLRDAAESKAADLAKRLEREEEDRQTLQQQVDALRSELHTAQGEAAQAAGKLGTEKMLREVEAAKVTDLRRQLDAPQARPKRRWWQF